VDIPDTLLGEAWYWAAWFVWVPVFALSLFRAQWSRLADSDQLSLWLGMVVLLTLIWSMKAGVKPGLGIHLLGACVFTLAFGPFLAFIGLCATTLGITLNGSAGGFSFALNALFMAGIGVCCSQFFYQISLRFLPKHFFVYIFIQGFLSSGLVALCVGLSISCLMGLAGVYTWQYLFDEYFPFFVLLSFSEAWLSGMILTLFVVYRPGWVVTFEDSRYLRDKL
jgi:uncharacterized membrane protein